MYTIMCAIIHFETALGIDVMIKSPIQQLEIKIISSKNYPDKNCSPETTFLSNKEYNVYPIIKLFFFQYNYCP